jgi:DNA polymerase-4
MEQKFSHRKIIHVDMDAFYASVEERDHPEWKGKPIVVSGPPNSRSVVCTANYAARKFGIHSAMPSSHAYKLCPDAIFVHPRFQVYKEISKEIRNIFWEYTELVEPLSLDEAYLDVTYNKKNMNSATLIAKEIKEKIYKTTQLTASAGVSNGKFLAKIASGMNKPNGLTVILPQDAETFLEKLPIGNFFGIGKVTEKKLLAQGIHTGKDLKSKTEGELQKIFGKQGSFYYKIVRGIDHSQVIPVRERKSFGVEETFPEDYSDLPILELKLKSIAVKLSNRLLKTNAKGKTITVKVKFSDFKSISKSLTIGKFISSQEEISNYAKMIFSEMGISQKVRLLGISLSSLEKNQEIDGLDLFSL